MKSILFKGKIDKKKEVCKFSKFHYLTHVVKMILEYGFARNFDGGPSESAHKYLTKAPGNRTQGRDNTFDE